MKRKKTEGGEVVVARVIIMTRMTVLWTEDEEKDAHLTL